MVTGANRHDVSQLEKVLNSIVTECPEPTAKNHQNLCADNGYTGELALEIIVLRGYIPHVVSRRQEKKNMENNPAYKDCRWVVEITHSWMNCFRKLLVRFEKTDAVY